MIMNYEYSKNQKIFFSSQFDWNLFLAFNKYNWILDQVKYTSF